MQWRRLGWAMGAFAAAGLAGALAFGGDGSLARARTEGLRIGYAVEPPYAYQTANGEVTGESPSIASHVCARLGLPAPVWRQYEFDMLIPELERGAIDVIAAGMFITEERAQRVSFSAPTVVVTQGLLVAAGNPLGLGSYAEAIAHPGARVAALSGSIEESLLRKLGATDADLLIVPDARTGRVAVESGEAQGMALSTPSIQWMALNGTLGTTEMAAPFEQPPGPRNRCAFAFRKTDAALRKAWDDVLAEYIGGEAHGVLAESFGFASLTAPAVAEAP